MTDKFEFIENLKTKKISQDQGFPFLTEDIPVDMTIQNTNEMYLIGEFGSILSGEIKVKVDVEWEGSGFNPSASYYVIDESGAEEYKTKYEALVADDERQFLEMRNSSSHYFYANVKSGSKYKIYVMMQMEGNICLHVYKYSISGNIIETFMPIVF